MMPTFSRYAQLYPRKLVLLGILLFLLVGALWVHFFLSPPVTGVPVVTEPQAESFESLVQKQLQALSTGVDTPPPSEEAVTAQLEALAPKEASTPTEADVTQTLTNLTSTTN
jgi:hypothetical protein